MITKVANEMTSVFGVELTMSVHDTILRAFIRNGHVNAACNWLQTMPQKPGHHTPTRAQWHLFLENIVNGTLVESFKYLRNVVKTRMRASGCRPSNETYKILIRGRWASYTDLPHCVVFKSIVDDIKAEDLPFDASIPALLYTNYAERGFPLYAMEIERHYHQQFPDRPSLEQQERRWVEWLADTAQSDGIKGAIKVFRTLEQEGCTPSPTIIRSLLRHSRHVKDIKVLEQELGIQPNLSLWSIVITNVCRTGNTSAAINIYRECKAAGFLPDAALVGPIIRALCQTSLPQPSDDSVNLALSIYEELAAVPHDAEDGQIAATTKHSAGPDAVIYQTLLRALATSVDAKAQFPKASALLADMEKRKISLNDSIVATSTIVLLMRNSENLDQAFHFYKSLSSSLDGKGYPIVLNAFCKLSLGPDDHVPSLPRYFEMVNDMRRAGHKMTPEVYTILLQVLPKLITTVRRVHDHLTLDASLSPDAHLLNQLMDTYQRLGCFGDACRAWEMMYLSGRFDHISVSIILDACGHAGSWQIAKRVCTQLSRDNFLFNQHNWNTWLECLCRLGMLNQAVKVACLEMGVEQDDVVPDVDTARVLISFARKANVQTEVSSRIQRYLPELWEQLPEDLRTQ
uniref:Pentatricopeptide repeat-containing protein n=1 Tax=Pleurotus djamor TaxID=34470 RepID=Q68ST0_PLEDJ|nr:hypothetical protein PDUPA1 [Pleurotus djamor]